MKRVTSVRYHRRKTRRGMTAVRSHLRNLSSSIRKKYERGVAMIKYEPPFQNLLGLWDLPPKKPDESVAEYIDMLQNYHVPKDDIYNALKVQGLDK